MDRRWRITSCPRCINGVLPSVGCEPSECPDCGGSGALYIRPKGHLFAWPGGPIRGMSTPEDYEQAEPFTPPSATYGPMNSAPAMYFPLLPQAKVTEIKEAVREGRMTPDEGHEAIRKLRRT